MNILYTKRGVTILPFDGPVSADPIFIKPLNEKHLDVKSFILFEPESDSNKQSNKYSKILANLDLSFISYLANYLDPVFMDPKILKSLAFIGP